MTSQSVPSPSTTACFSIARSSARRSSRSRAARSNSSSRAACFLSASRGPGRPGPLEHPGRAGAHREHPEQRVHRVADVPGVAVRAEAPGALPLGPAHDHDPGVLIAHGDGQVRVALVVPVLDVEPGVELLDPGVFELQGLDLGADHGPLDAGRGLQHHLGARVQAGEVGEVLIQPLAQRLRLADVDHPAALVAEPVHPWGFGNLARRRPEGNGPVRISHEATLRSPGSNGAVPRPATMAFVGTFFASTGRLAVRFRWAIVLAWAAGAAAALALLPSLSSVTQSDNTSFLAAR